MTDDITQGTFEDIPEDVTLTDGRYVFQVIRTKLDKLESSGETKDFGRVTLKALQVVDSGLTDDDLLNARTVPDRWWLHTTGGKKMTKSNFEKFGVDVGNDEDGWKTYPELFEELIGLQIEAQVKKGVSDRGTEYVEVERYFTL